MDIFGLGLFWGVFTFIFFGQIVGVQISFLNRLKFSFLQTLWFQTFMGGCYVLKGLKPGLIMGLAGLVLHKVFALSKAEVILTYISCSSIYLTYFLVKWYLIKGEALQIFASFIPTVVLIVVRRGYWPGPVDVLVWGYFLGLLAVSPAAAVLRVFLQSGRKRGKLKSTPSTSRRLNPQSAGKGVVFIGLDGCDWKLLNRFLEEGRLPTLKKLIANGTLGRLKSVYPTDSPLIWNSILTGKEPLAHGITYWYKTKFPLLPPIDKRLFYQKDSGGGKIVNKLIKKNIAQRVPFSTQDRKAKAVWNILSDYGKNSLNVGWIYSWPAETIRGVQISWYMYPFEEAAEANIKRFKSSGLARRVYPENLVSELEKFIVRPSDLGKEELKNMHFPTVHIDPKRKFADKLNPWDYAKDKAFLKMSHYLLEKGDFDFFSLYLYGIDAVCHTYWPFFASAVNNGKYKKEILSVSDAKEFREQAQSFGQCIARYYEYLDQEIARILDKVGDDCNIIIASDHGFNFDGTVHDNAPDAVLIARGPYIRKKLRLENISIYDLLPSLLTLLGIPVARDMPGRIIEEMLTENFLTKFPPQYIESHEGPKDKKDIDDTLDDNTRQGVEERLKALGYI